MMRCVALLCGCALIAGCTPSFSVDSAYAPSVARIAAATDMIATCEDIVPGLEIAENYTISAADFEAAQTGLDTQKIRAVLFYGDRQTIHAARDTLLVERGVDANDSAALCAYGARIAGTDDPIGLLIAKR